jgi:hypothetical protein
MTRVEQAAEKARLAREKADEFARTAQERAVQVAAERQRLTAERRLARLAKAQSAKQQAEARKADGVHAEAVRREEERRRYPVGRLAHDAGLFVYTNEELRPIFAVLGRAGHIDDLAPMLAEMLGVTDDASATPDAQKSEASSTNRSVPDWARFGVSAVTPES